MITAHEEAFAGDESGPVEGTDQDAGGISNRSGPARASSAFRSTTQTSTAGTFVGDWVAIPFPNEEEISRVEYSSPEHICTRVRSNPRRAVEGQTGRRRDTESNLAGDAETNLSETQKPIASKMGRRSGRSSARSAPRRSASSSAASPRRSTSPTRRGGPPARTAAKAPVKSAAGAAPSAKAGTNAPAQQGSAMGGFMANVASTGMGVMAGRAMDRAFFGGGNREAPVEGDEAGAEEYYAAGIEDGEIDQGVCSREILEFKKCLERTGTDMTECKWNLDILTACQQQQQQQLGFADAGRF